MTEDHHKTIKRLADWITGDVNERPLRVAAIAQLNRVLGVERATEGIERGYGVRYLNLLETFEGPPMTEKMTLDKFATLIETQAREAATTISAATQKWSDDFNATFKAAVEADLDFDILLSIILTKGRPEMAQPKVDLTTLLKTVEKALGLKNKTELKIDPESDFAKAAAQPRKIEINKNLGAPYKPVERTIADAQRERYAETGHPLDAAKPVEDDDLTI